MQSLVDEPWLVLDLSFAADDAPWVEMALVTRGLEGWEVQQEYPDYRWRLYLPLHGEYQERLAELTDALQEIGCRVDQSGHIRDEDWSENWKEFYHPFAVGEQLVISPSWEEPDPELAVGREVIRLDPGSAFGTGYHESTRLCLELLQDLTAEPGWKETTTLDYGTGSGILAIACLKLGSGPVLAADRDPLAVAVASANLEFNGYSKDRYRIEQHDLPPANPDADDGRYSFVVANLTADILTQLSTPIAAVCKRHLLVGGIVEKRTHRVVDAFTRLGARVQRTVQENEWLAYHLIFDETRVE